MGEDEACAYLETQSYKILERNFRTRKGELDIIALSPQNTLCFIEVKSDISGTAGSPESWIKPAKIRQVQRMAQYYCAIRRPEQTNMRYDAIGVILKGPHPQIRHIENAFIPDSSQYR